jgi:quercetin dioxygenase-like cupin family protein
VSTTGASSGGVTIVRLAEDAPRIEAAPGVVVRHLVGQDLMVRVVDLAPGSSVSIEEPEQEHAVIVRSGTVRIGRGGREWEVSEDCVAMVRRGLGFSLTGGGDTAAQCELVSTPPDVALVRDLLHLEHADHGFD